MEVDGDADGSAVDAVGMDDGTIVGNIVGKSEGVAGQTENCELVALAQ
jgi:hypothetical protein